MTAPRITAASWIMVLLLGFTWGGTFMINEIALRDITPLWLAAGRIGFGALASVIVWQLMGGHLFEVRPAAGQWVVLGVVGAFSSAVPFMLIAWGQQYVTAGFAGISMASAGLMVLPLAHFFVAGERMTLRRVLGFLIGFAGVVLLIGTQGLESTGAALELPGRIACIAAASCYAVGGILMRRLPAIDPIGLATVLLLMGSAIVLPLAMIVEGPPPLPPAHALWIVAFLGLVPTAAANFLRVKVVRTAGPVFMSLTNYQVPMWSVLLGVAFLSEPLPPRLLAALALILAGVAISQLGALRALWRR